jgi:hypothetical protein
MQKVVLKVVLGLYKVGTKWLFWNCGYAYILSGRRDRISVMNTSGFLCDTAPRRWTAIGVGAIRYQTAIGALSTASVPRAVTFLYDARVFVRAHYSCIFLSCAYSTMIILATVYIPMKISVNSNVCIYWLLLLLIIIVTH